ncbi:MULTISPECIES: MBL fold metallo-hydrolase [unclassified Streptomyces]|uniref:MBL fold metallo-hydrolase n=1 Tax=Streptomyces sp. NPDC127129 TaxID=3345373 RepID=UPI00363A55A2
MVLVSDAHEDHVAGLGSYEVPVRIHEKDLPALRSRRVMAAGYGLPPEATEQTETMLRDHFHVRDRTNATGFADGTVFDLGGRTVTVVHLPGHTAGHCSFLIEPDGFLCVAHTDLTSFGPYYGDVGSSLTDFEASMRRCRVIDARWYGTAHQRGVIEGAAEFSERQRDCRPSTGLPFRCRGPPRAAGRASDRGAPPEPAGPHGPGLGGRTRTVPRHVTPTCRLGVREVPVPVFSKSSRVSFNAQGRTIQGVASHGCSRRR